MSDNPQTNDTTTIPRRILVIEDDLDSAEVLKTFLEIHGHEITVKHNGESGLESVKKIIPDVIICDISLSDELDGYNVAEEIKRNEHLNSVYLIALSGYGRPEDQERSKSAGFDKHFVKPTDYDALLEVLNDFDRE